MQETIKSISLKNELQSVLDIKDIHYYRNTYKNNKFSAGWFKITKNTSICQARCGVNYASYLCIEVRYPNRDELKFKLYNDAIVLEVRSGFINIFTFKHVQHCRFTPDLSYDMYHQYMFIEDHWNLSYDEYSVLNKIYNKCKDNLLKEEKR